jgi:deoxycytidine triphosphate deaminase
LVSKAYLDLRVRQEIKVFTDHKDLLVCADLQDPR